MQSVASSQKRLIQLFGSLDIVSGGLFLLGGQERMIIELGAIRGQEYLEVSRDFAGRFGITMDCYGPYVEIGPILDML